MISLKAIYESLKIPDENSKFLQLHSGIRPVWIDISNDMVADNTRWARELTNQSNRDKETIRYWEGISINKFPPIIVGNYGSGFKVLDGRHRLNAAIRKGCKKIKALIEPNIRR